MFGKLSIRSKLLLLLLVSGVGGAVLLGMLSLTRSSEALRASIYDQLTAIRETRKAEVQRYVTGVQSSFALFAAQDGMGEAANQFRLAFKASGEALTEAEREVLNNYYEEKVIKPLGDLLATQQSIRDYMPAGNPAKRLQYQYIAASKYGDDRKQQALRPSVGDTSRDVYARVHERIHPKMMAALDDLRLNDLYLIDHVTGNVLYSVTKKPDFVTNLVNGPYRTSALARLFDTVIKNINLPAPALSDFEKYSPVNLKPVAFIAMPVFHNGRLAGIIAGRTSSDILNTTLTGDGKWAEQGLGKSGEVYLVGSDFKLRTDSRFYLEDRFTYLQSLVDAGAPEIDRRNIVRSESTVLNQTVDTSATRKALEGQSGTEIIKDYRGVEVLSAYAPLNLGNLRWAIMAEKDVAEALGPIDQLRRTILLATGTIAVLLTLFSLLAAAAFLRPINRLRDGVAKLSSGDDKTRINVTGKDEFASLGHAFNSMVEGIAERNEKIRQSTQEYENLLRSVLPEAVADRVSLGNMIVADTFENVTAIYANIDGFASVMREVDAGEMIRLMNELIDGFDEAAERHGVEKIKTVGDVYLAACGLPLPRLDHSQRAFKFAEEMLIITERFNKANGLSMKLRIGLDSGEVDAGIVGRRRFVYEILGQCVVNARQLALGKTGGNIRMSQTVQQSIEAGDGPVSEAAQ
jgi:class 3 adenylate cyclase